MRTAGVISILLAISLLGAIVTPRAIAQSGETAMLGLEEPPVLVGPIALQVLVGPIALYPDSIIAHILPASTVPIDVVEAARYLRDHGGKVEEPPDVPWLPSVRALLRFPDVLYKMDEEIAWTQELGAAVVAQQNDVMDAIQHVRKLAEEMGALQTNEKQIVQVEKEVIKIVPADPEVIYVPVYAPQIIYVEDDYDDEAAAALVGFGVGVLVGAAFADDDCDWYGHHISHYGYYGWADVDIHIDNAWVWRPGPGGAYDPRGLYDPKGAYDPRGVYDPRGAYDPRGVADTRGLADTRGVVDPRGAAASSGYANPSATSRTGTFGSVGQNSSLSRQSTRGASSLSSSGSPGSAFSSGGRSGGGRGRR